PDAPSAGAGARLLPLAGAGLLLVPDGPGRARRRLHARECREDRSRAHRARRSGRRARAHRPPRRARRRLHDAEPVRYLLTLALLVPALARANPWDLYGFGPRAQGLAGAF